MHLSGLLAPLAATPAAVPPGKPVPATLLLGSVRIGLGVYVGALRGTWHAHGAADAAAPGCEPVGASRGAPGPDEGEARDG